MNRRDTALLDAINNVNSALNQITAGLARVSERLDAVENRLEMLEVKVDAVMGALTDHANDPYAHGGEP